MIITRPFVLILLPSLSLAARPKLAMLRLSTAELRAGQILAKDFVSPEGVLLLSAGQRLGDDLIERIRGFERKHGLSLLLSVQPLPEGAR